MARMVNAINLAEAQKSSSWIIDFVSIIVDASETTKTVHLCTHFENIVVGSGNSAITYVAAGQFLGFSNISDDLEAKDNSLDLSLSGVQDTFTSVVLQSYIEGSLVDVRRGFFNESTGALVADPEIRWSGRINSFSIKDDHSGTDNDKVVIAINCKSLLSTILGRQNGRFTSTASFGTDTSMEFVASLGNFSPFFGKEND